jgi:hypothetical protein
VLTLGLLSFGSTAQAASINPNSPAAGHPYRHGVVPTQEAQAKMRQSQAIPAAANDLNYGGAVDGIGVTTGAPKVYLVFYGSQWGTAGTDANGNTTFSGDSQGMAPRLQQLFKGIGTNGELYSGVMTQYCQGVSAGSQTCPATAAHVGYPTGGAFAGVWADTGSASPSQATGHQLGVVAVAAASHFGNTTAAANRNSQYVIVSPHGTFPDGFNTANANSVRGTTGTVTPRSPAGPSAPRSATSRSPTCLTSQTPAPVAGRTSSTPAAPVPSTV